METKERVAELSKRVCKELVCPKCKGDKFHVGVTDIQLATSGHVAVHCDCGYGITFNFNPLPAGAGFGLTCGIVETEI